MPSCGGYTSSCALCGCKGLAPLCRSRTMGGVGGSSPSLPMDLCVCTLVPHESITSELLGLAQQLYNFLGRFILYIIVVDYPVELLSALLCDGCDSG